MLDVSSSSTPAASVRRPTLIRADSRLRNKWLAATAFLAFVLALLLWVSPSLQENLTRLISDNSAESVFRLLVIFYSVFAILAIILITIGLHLAQVARKVWHSGRFPAPGMRVVRDTWVVRGNQALFLSCFFMGVAVVLILGGGSIPFYFHELLVQLMSPG